MVLICICDAWRELHSRMHVLVEVIGAPLLLAIGSWLELRSRLIAVLVKLRGYEIDVGILDPGFDEINSVLRNHR